MEERNGWPWERVVVDMDPFSRTIITVPYTDPDPAEAATEAARLGLTGPAGFLANRLAGVVDGSATPPSAALPAWAVGGAGEEARVKAVPATTAAATEGMGGSPRSRGDDAPEARATQPSFAGIWDEGAGDSIGEASCRRLWSVAVVPAAHYDRKVPASGGSSGGRGGGLSEGARWRVSPISAPLALFPRAAVDSP